MDLQKNLKIKYLTGAFMFTEKDIDPIGETIKIVEEVRRQRKTKKKWSEDDIVFGTDVLKNVYGENADDVINTLVEKNIIEQSDSQYKINSELLNSVYEWK
jgi:hypothetical protein